MADPTPPPPDGPETGPPRRPTARWLRLTLFLSLALNLAMLGLIGGAVLAQRKPDGPPPDRLVRDLGLGPYLRALSPADRRAIAETAYASGDRLRGYRSTLRAAFRDSLALLRSDPFDRAAFADSLARQAAVADRGRALGQTLLVDRIAAMTAAERAALADSLAREVRHRRAPPKD